MAAVDEVQVNVKVKDDEEEVTAEQSENVAPEQAAADDFSSMDDFGDDLWQEGYEQGTFDGWLRAASDVIESIYRNFDNPEDIKERIFPEIADQASGMSAEFAQMLAHGNQEQPPNESNSEVSAWDESTIALGKRGEEAACRYLQRSGYEIVARNWRCVFGEVDIIAVDGDGTIVFVEVKTRRSSNAGFPEEAVTKEKRHRYERIAMSYMAQADWNEEHAVRFDAIAICVCGENRAMLRHHRGYFDGRS